MNAGVSARTFPFCHREVQRQVVPFDAESPESGFGRFTEDGKEVIVRIANKLAARLQLLEDLLPDS